MTTKDDTLTVDKVLEIITLSLGFTRERSLEKVADFKAKLAVEGASIASAIGWSSEAIEAEFTYVFVARIERAVENGFDLIDILRERVERMGDDLLSNRYTAASTSHFANAVEGAEAKAVSGFYRMVKDWLRMYDGAEVA